MGKEILRDVTLEVNGVDLSEFVNQIEVDDTATEVDVTGMKAKNKETLLDIGDGSITATLFQSFDEKSVHATLAPLKKKNEPFVVAAIPKEGEVSETNPAFVLQEAILPGYKPISGARGAASTLDVAFKNAGQKGMVECTTPEELEKALKGEL